MRRMARRLVTVPARIMFIVCGLTTLVTGVPYVILRGANLPVAAFAILGMFSFLAGVLPRSWISAASKTPRDQDRLFSVPLTALGIFAVVFYLVAVFAFYAPHSWNLNPQIMFALCPLYFVKMTIDPLPVSVFFIFAPMNAAVYGSLGVIVGYARLRFQKHN